MIQTPTVDGAAKTVKIDHNKVSRVWKEGGPKIENVTIGLYHDTKDNKVIVQFSDQLGPVFRAIFDRPALHEVLDYLYDGLLEIDLDEAEKAREKDKDEEK